MATKIRLTRLGKKKQPTYRVVVMDSRKPRDGKYIEQLGIYDPRQNPSLIKIDNERALHWLHTGAQPTERAQKLLEISGAWTQFRIAKGDIHTVDDAPTVQEVHVVEDIHTVDDAPPVQEIHVVEDTHTVEADEPAEEAVTPEATTDDSSEEE